MPLQITQRLRTHIYYHINHRNQEATGGSFTPFKLVPCVLVIQSCPTLCDLMDCSPSGSSVHGILQARILEWVAMPSSRGSSWPRGQIPFSCIAGRFFTIWATREALQTGTRHCEMESIYCQLSLVGYSPWGCYESDVTERLHFHFSLSCIGEGNGNPLQCSCLENPKDSGAWWAAIYGVSQSQTRLKQLSSSSSKETLDPIMSMKMKQWLENV